MPFRPPYLFVYGSKKLTEKPEYEQYAERCYGDAHQASRSHTSAGNSSSGSIRSGAVAIRTDKSDKSAYDAGYDYNPNPHICIDVKFDIVCCT